MTEANDRSGMGVDYDPDVDAYYAEFDSSETSASTAVVEAIASIRHCEPTELEPLYNSVDSDALDAIIGGSDNGSVTVSLVANDIDVAVRSDGTVEIEPPEIGDL